MSSTPEGVPLAGGNSGVVVRQGDTVRRPSGPWTGQVQQAMRDLRAAGLTFVPEPLGLDNQGREVVEFIDGDVGVYPMPAWVWTDALLAQVARALRQLHDTSTSMSMPRSGWRREPVEPVEVLCHGDVAPYNTVCRDGQLVSFIDWDYAQPAPRGWDLGYAAYRWVSLTRPGHPDGCPLDLEEQRRRLELFCAQYGDVQSHEVIAWAVVRLEDLVQHSRARAADGEPAFVATVAAGHADLYEADAKWLRATYQRERERGSFST